jgi:hypothetical protein
VVPASISSVNVGESVVYRPILSVNERLGIDLVFRRDEEDPAVTNFLDIVRRDGR